MKQYVNPVAYVGLRPEVQRMSRLKVRTDDPERILMAVCIALDVHRDDILDRTRRHEITEARAICYRIMRDLDMKLVYIGQFFGVHHSTVINGVKTYDALSEVDDDFKRKVYKVKRVLEIW